MTGPDLHTTSPKRRIKFCNGSLHDRPLHHLDSKTLASRMLCSACSACNAPGVVPVAEHGPAATLLGFRVWFTVHETFDLLLETYQVNKTHSHTHILP